MYLISFGNITINDFEINIFCSSKLNLFDQNKVKKKKQFTILIYYKM